MSRIDRINEFVKRELGNLILFGKIADPRVKPVTIQKVDVTKDLQIARVHFSILSDKPMDIKNALDGLNSSKGLIRKLIGSELELRYTPDFQFFYDRGTQYAAQIDKTLEEIKHLGAKPGEQDA